MNLAPPAEQRPDWDDLPETTREVLLAAAARLAARLKAASNPAQPA